MRRLCSVFVGVIVAVVVCGVAPAFAAGSVPGVWWGVISYARPASLPEGKIGQLVVDAQDRGYENAEGAGDPIRIVDRLPAGLSVVSIGAVANVGGKTVPVDLKTCKTIVGAAVSVECVDEEALHVFNQIEVVIGVRVGSGARSGAASSIVVSGGGAESVASASVPVRIGGDTENEFGIDDYQLLPEAAGGGVDTQAGSHPFQLTTVIGLNQTVGSLVAGRLARSIEVHWPAGLVGNPTPFPRCTDEQFSKGGPDHETNECPPETVVGIVSVLIDEPGKAPGWVTVPLFNMTPTPGEPARFGFQPGGAQVFLNTSVRSGRDYGVNIVSRDITQIVAFEGIEVTAWGVPGDARHDSLRGWLCTEEKASSCGLGNGPTPAFLSLPSSCERPFSTSIQGESWPTPSPAEGGAPLQATGPTFTLSQGLTGCGEEAFEPSIRVTPDVSQASSPSGVSVDVHVPQQESVAPQGISEADPRDITVALPAGVAVNPSGGDGLAACSEGLVGFEGLSKEYELEEGAHTAVFGASPGLSEAKPGVDFCSDASKIGTASIRTPLLPKPVSGSVYLATQNENPFGSLVAMYIVAEDSEAGVLVKLAGQVALCKSAGETIAGIACAAPGQIVTTFENSPQVPFEDAELHFFGEERAPLATPAYCGSYTTQALFTPWSAEPGEQAHPAESTFQISSGPKTAADPNGSPCPGSSLPFSPSLTGGTINDNAGSFSSLSTTIGREDGNQNMQSVTLNMPPGLSGTLTGVKLCPEAQANEGTCSAESLIGETTVSAGVGNDPVSVKGGKVYLTEKYAGAPFGLSIVNPVKAGPFDLEHDTSPADPGYTPPCDCVVVRAKVEVNPLTAALTVTTDESGPHAIPHFIDGIPVQIKRVNVLINRPGFTFNASSCEPMKITGTIKSDEGASSPVSVPFQTVNCGNLKFEPKVEATVSGKVTKQNGTSFVVKISKPAVQGVQADLRKFKIELPVQLPSRLTTLQKACTAAQFEANPAGCPTESDIGHMRALTPILPVPIEGPMYFVSHGGEAFPSLEIVLQGYGVTVDLVGTTFISKAGITSSTFSTLPDVPFTFAEASLHNGPYSALTGIGNLCAPTKTVTVKMKIKIKTKHGAHKTITRKVKKTEPTSLTMPTELVAQSGGNPIKVDTTVHVTECPKSAVKTHKNKKKSKKSKKKGGKPAAKTGKPGA